MPDYYQKEDASGVYQLEDGSGNYLLEQQGAAANPVARLAILQPVLMLSAGRTSGVLDA